MGEIPYLTFRETSPIDSHFNLVRHKFKPRTGFYLHGHKDFMDLFWVESGSGWHQVNGQKQRLEAGMLVMVRVRDVHGYTTEAGETLTVVNLSFPRTSVAGWHRRYFSDQPLFFWSREDLPYSQILDSAQMQRLQKWTDHLSTCPNAPLHFDWFLLDLFHSLQPNKIFGKEDAQMPERLTLALRQIREPQHFSGGVHRLAKLAGCSLQHLNRLLKKHRALPAGEIVTEARLRHAARQLRLTDRKIVDIGLEVGYNNLGHFYLLFKKRYGHTPRQFRLQQQLAVGQRT